MPLPALHTVSLAPARHLLACQRVVELDLWHENPVLRLLQRCQVTTRWLMARYLLEPEAPATAGQAHRDGIARRLIAEVCAEIEAEETELVPRLRTQVTSSPALRDAGQRRSGLRRLTEALMDVPPGSRRFDQRMLALGKAFERHLHQLMLQLGPLAHRPLGHELGHSMQMRHHAVMATLADHPA